MKILIVDDEADVQPLFLQHFRKELRHHDFEFDFALSGEEALEYLKRKSSEVVLILSDINMETPFLASAKATACGVLTTTAPVIGNDCIMDK